MSKLFKLKDWLTVPEAARHLTTLFDEHVSESDVLRLALDRRLTLSIYFVNKASAKKCKLIPWTVAERVPSLCGEHSVALGQYWDDKQALVPDGDDEVQVIDGVFDLTMNGGDWLDVERRYHQLTGGPECELVAWESTVVRSVDGQYWALEIEASKLLGPGEKGYHVPLCGLPDDGVLVVRTSALQELCATLLAPVERVNQPNARAETTYLNIIGGLLGLMLGKTPAGKDQSVFGSQSAIISALLAHYENKPGMAHTTLEQKFAEANRSIKAT